MDRFPGGGVALRRSRDAISIPEFNSHFETGGPGAVHRPGPVAFPLCEACQSTCHSGSSHPSNARLRFLCLPTRPVVVSGEKRSNFNPRSSWPSGVARISRWRVDTTVCDPASRRHFACSSSRSTEPVDRCVVRSGKTLKPTSR